MAGTKNQNSFSMLDLSGGFQNATSHLLKKRQELYDSQNAAYDIIIGAAVRRFGYEPVGQILAQGRDSLYGGLYVFAQNSRIIAGANNASGSNAQLSFLDVGGNWTPFITNAAPNTRFRCLNYLDNLFVAGETAGQYFPLTSVNNQMQPSNTTYVLNAPACKYIAQYAGQLYAINCQVNVNGALQTYRDRAYVSSPPLGVVTQVQAQYLGYTTQIHVDSVHYLKVGMSVDIFGAQTKNLKVQGLQIVSVDKLNNMIGFSGQNLPQLNIDDEVWISGTYGQQVILWNTDYPSPESADWIRVPPALGEGAEFTGWTVNNNRLLLFTKNAVIKWDGTNLVTLRSTVGCVNHETIQNIGLWTIWLHTSGLWGYNDTTGQFKMISRAVLPFLKRINPSNYKYLSAVTDQHNYKLSLSQLMDPVLQTTSTSTSSTSTSSTSSSTSSTSTSSTSTSSSITQTTTSTSSSSTSTSSTSVSSTSSSISTSSTSSSSTSTSQSSTSSSTSTSSTTTQLPNKQCIRLIYNFDLNIYWYEVHTREQRFQFMHTMNGYTKPYFTDENGYLFRDETGFSDNGNAIPMMIRSGRTNCGTEQAKTWNAIQVDSENARGATVYYSLDGGDWKTHPGWQLTDNIQTLNFPQKGQLIGSRDIDFMIQHSDLGDPPAVNGLTVYFTLKESVVNEMGESK